MQAKKKSNSKGRRIFQVHPSALCNYECMHCYSWSSPKFSHHIPLKILCSAISDACQLGYTNLSISGGEPLLYPHLADLLKFAKALGMKTSLITNGSFPAAKYIPLKSLVDTLGVSLDGSPCLHNKVRKNDQAFRRVDRFLNFAKTYFDKIGISLTLSDQSWEDLEFLFCYAESKEIDIFQIHPLELTGRASHQNRLSLSEDNLERTFILVELLKSQYSFAIKCDVVPLVNDHNFLDYYLPNIYAKSPLAARIVDLIVMENSGDIVPYTFGMSARWRIANVYQEQLVEGWKKFQDNKLLDFHSHCTTALTEYAKGHILGNVAEILRGALSPKCCHS